MKNLTMAERREAYAQSEMGKKYPASIPWTPEDGRLYAVWILGQDYRNKAGYHGEFPPSYLQRVMSLFPDAERVLHVFSGSLPRSDKYTRLDMRDDIESDIQGNAENLAALVGGRTFDLVHADPPYTEEDAHKYGTPLVNRNKVVTEAAKVLEPGGYLVWFDMVLPMYRKAEFELAGMVGISRSTNHRFRSSVLFRRL